MSTAVALWFTDVGYIVLGVVLISLWVAGGLWFMKLIEEYIDKSRGLEAFLVYFLIPPTLIGLILIFWPI